MPLPTPTRTLTPALASLVAFAALACTDTGTEPARSTLVPSVDEPSYAAKAARRAMKVRAKISFVGEVVPLASPCLQELSAVWTGNATHLGRFEGEATTCILDVVAPDPDPPFDAPGEPPYVTAAFTNPLIVLTAANGDELWLTSGDAVAVCRLANFFQCRARGTTFVIGGTGRFEGATGELAAGAVNDDGAGPDDYEADGWIRF